jgi:hypothetical protein
VILVTAAVEHDGNAYRAELDSVGNVSVYAAGELHFIGYWAEGTIRTWSAVEGDVVDALDQLDKALRAQNPILSPDVAAARAAGVDQERARCLWLIQRGRLEALDDEDMMGATRLRAAYIYVEAGTQRPTRR